MAESDIEQQITAASSKPQSATQDGFTVTQRSLSELIEADRYIQAKKAARQPSRGLRYSKIKPPGAT